MLLFFFFNDTATTEIYTLSLHDALPICSIAHKLMLGTATIALLCFGLTAFLIYRQASASLIDRSEEHTSELQSQSNLVCRLLLEKKKKKLYRRLSMFA